GPIESEPMLGGERQQLVGILQQEFGVRTNAPAYQRSVPQRDHQTYCSSPSSRNQSLISMGIGRVRAQPSRQRPLILPRAVIPETKAASKGSMGAMITRG